MLTSEQEGEEVKPDLVQLDALAEKLRQKLSRKMREEDFDPLVALTDRRV